MTAFEPIAAAYRRSAAGLPGGDPRPTHGAEMEGYFWRFTLLAAGLVDTAIIAARLRAVPDKHASATPRAIDRIADR